MGDQSLSRSPSSDEGPPLFFYLAESQLPDEKEEPSGPSLDVSGKGKEKAAPSSPPPPLTDSQANYFVPNFGSSGNFSEGGSPEEHRGKATFDNEDVSVSHSVAVDRKYQDPIFALLFWITFGAMFFIAIVVHANGANSWKAVEGRVTDALFLALSESSSVIFMILLLGILSGILLLFLLRGFIKVTVWAMVTLVPLVLLSCSIWCFVSTPPRKSSKIAITILGVVCFVSSLCLTAFLVFARTKINTSIAFLKLATHVLKDRPSLFLVSILTSSLYLALTIFWYWNFSWIFTIGYQQDRGLEVVWVPYAGSYALSAFLLFGYLWTSSILNYIQIYVLSEVTCHWYFHRSQPTRKEQGKISTALWHSLTTSFGSICLASFLYSTLRLLQFFLHQFSRATPSRFGRVASCCQGCLGVVTRLVDSLNKYALAYCALSGQSFCASNRVTFSVFRRNLLDRLTIVTISHFVLLAWVLSLSLLFGLSLLTYVSHSLSSAYGWASGLSTFMFSYFILRFYSDMLLSIVDSLFMCYAIDCDTNSSLLGNHHTSNLVVHETLESIFRANQNVVVYSQDEDEM